MKSKNPKPEYRNPKQPVRMDESIHPGGYQNPKSK